LPKDFLFNRSDVHFVTGGSRFTPVIIPNFKYNTYRCVFVL